MCIVHHRQEFGSKYASRRAFRIKMIETCILLAVVASGNFSTIAVRADEPPSDIVLSNSSKIVFLNARQAKEQLSRSDEFTKRTQPLERQFRLQSARPISEKEFLQFAGQQTLDWNEREIAAIRNAFASLHRRDDLSRLPFPAVIHLAKTTGKEEGDAAYCRDRTIIFSTKTLKSSPAGLQRLVVHELFHILSRTHPDVRDELYKIIGFRRQSEISLPPSLMKRRLTNPDAPTCEHTIDVTYSGKPVTVLPVTLLSTDVYQEGNMFRFLQFRLLAVETTNDDRPPQVTLDNDKPFLLEAQKIPSFQQQIGSNTGYIIHPEEILADNFALLMTNKTEVPDPWLLERMETILFSNDTESPAR